MATGIVVQTDRLALRPVEPADAPATAALMTPAVAARLLSWPAPMSVAQARRRIDASRAALAAGTGADLAILHDGRLIGWIGAHLVAAPRRLGSIGYWLGAEVHGRGYMAEAAHAALPWLVDRLALAAVEAGVQPHNFASQAILEGLGLQIKARRRLVSPSRGTAEDAIVFAAPAARLTLSPRRAPERRAAAMTPAHRPSRPRPVRAHDNLLTPRGRYMAGPTAIADRGTSHSASNDQELAGGGPVGPHRQ
jgi:RimJ/RimL family protein N-acetyltransferase